jgi:hypothetical protein
MSSKCFAVFALMMILFTEAQSRAADMTLWYITPAKAVDANGRPQPVVNEALPIGNGRIGGMILGGLKQETVVFNEDSLWTGTIAGPAPARGSTSAPSTQPVAARGGRRGGRGGGAGGGKGAYQACSTLNIDLPGHDGGTEYRPIWTSPRH